MKISYTLPMQQLELVTERPEDWLLIGQLSRTVKGAHLRNYPEGQKTLDIDVKELLKIAANAS